jgi:hypothetical protein
MIGTTRQKPKILAAHRYIFSVNALGGGFFLSLGLRPPEGLNDFPMGDCGVLGRTESGEGGGAYS